MQQRRLKRIFSLAIVAAWLAVGKDKPTDHQWGDLGNGTYANPILPGDFSDLDAIRVGNDYYAISSTLQYSPGMAVLHSKDLVNWRMAGHVVPDLRQISPELNWDRMNRPGRGVWAGSIRFHKGRYWVYFATPDEGLFMSTAETPAGPWEPLKAAWRVNGWDDPCPFWDDDGQAYLVITNFAQGYKIHLFKMDASGQRLLPESDRIIHQSKGSEANKLYKINGLYYHYFSEVRPEGRVAMMERAHSLAGPWESRQIIHVNPAVDKEPNQGGLIQIPSGKWYFLTHQGTGDWEGRAAVLLPVTWIDGWPIPGRVGKDGIGNMLWRAGKPLTGFPEWSPWASDDFSRTTLRPEWEWNYQPRAGAWSLTERPGYLRLHAFPPLRNGQFLRTRARRPRCQAPRRKGEGVPFVSGGAQPRPLRFPAAGNVLSQRAARTARNQVTVVFDGQGMADDEEAGLAHYAKTYCTLGVRLKNGVRSIVLNRDGQTLQGPEIHQPGLWLRSTWGFDGLSQFSYSFDGHQFHDFGPPYQLTWGAYRGDRVGLFTLNDSSASGYVDIGRFTYTVAR
jgi:beta-xylosidase